MFNFLGTHEFRVDLTDYENNYSFATYASFALSGEGENYKLHIGAFTGGSAGNVYSGSKDMHVMLYYGNQNLLE